MKKFNKLFTENTKVQIAGEYGYRSIVGINSSRTFAKITGLTGSYQRQDILKFTNSNAEMYPALIDKYTTDQYHSVYERGDSENIFVGKLNGSTLKEFVRNL